MTPERWRQITAVFHGALERDVRDRAAFLADACGGDEALRREVEVMLAQPPSSDGFLAGPAIVAAPVLDSTAGSVLTGRRFGPYQIQACIGAGGMGEVYCARDTKLGRDVAIKILPRAFTNNPERLARFEREARVLAALNHPHIGAIYGSEEAEGIRGLVLELIVGETLAARLRRGPIPVAESVRIAGHIVDALDAAHDKGIVHRDLKPSNIMVTPDGTTKVLDFGIAKLDGRASGDDRTRFQPEEKPASAIAGDGTETGRILGTTAYMSPEQTRGSGVDKRADIWSFGCVVFEMLTSRAAFGRETVPDTIAAILEGEPDWGALPPMPGALSELLRHCLEKDPRRRLRDIGDGRVALDHSSRAAASHQGKTRPSWGRRAAVLALAAAAGVAVWLVRDPGAAIDSLAVTVRPFNNLPGDQRDVAMSPKGDLIAYRQHGEKASEVWLADTKTTRAEKLTEERDDLQLPVRSQGFNADGSEVWLAGGVDRRLRRVRRVGDRNPRDFLGVLAINVAWSPKGDRIVYHTREKGDPISVADADGENPRVIARAEENVHQHYQAWSPDERWIYFVRGVQATYQWDLYRVAVDNKAGEPERLTYHDSEVAYPTPVDRRTILYVAKDQDGSGPWLWALDVDQKLTRRIIEGGLDRYTSLAASAEASTLVATAARPTARLWSVPILDRLVEEKDVTSFPLPRDKAPPSITRALMPRIGREALFFLSSRGEGDGLWRVGLRSNAYQDREPVELWNGAKGALHVPPATSSDGRSVIVRRIDGKLQLHVISTDGAARPLTDKVDARGSAGWSPDNDWVVTGGSVGGNDGLFKVPVGGGDPTRIFSGTALDPVWSPIGDVILYSGKNTGPLADLYAVRPDGTPIELPKIQLRVGGERYRFLPGRTAFVYMQGYSPAQDFFLFDPATSKPPRRLTRLSGSDAMRTFDVTPDGKRIVFDRLRENSDIVLIDLKR